MGVERGRAGVEVGACFGAGCGGVGGVEGIWGVLSAFGIGSVEDNEESGFEWIEASCSGREWGPPRTRVLGFTLRGIV